MSSFITKPFDLIFDGYGKKLTLRGIVNIKGFF